MPRNIIDKLAWWISNKKKENNLDMILINL